MHFQTAWVMNSCLGKSVYRISVLSCPLHQFSGSEVGGGGGGFKCCFWSSLVDHGWRIDGGDTGGEGREERETLNVGFGQFWLTMGGEI